jgi:beta-lactamase superfamily II metal-dependent hydrolase
MMALSRVAAICAALVVVAAAAADDQLRIYFIDVEGGQSTLIVTPQRHAILVDAGYPGNRDADRVIAAARDAGVTALDYLLVTHFHQDHLGGVPEVARRLPVTTFIDYGQPLDDAAVPPAVWTAYSEARARGRQLHPQPGDDLTLDGVRLDFASAGGTLTTKRLAGATRTTDVSCTPVQRGTGDEGENPRSLGFRLRFGDFAFLDLGDLPGLNLAALVCPKNLLGYSDVYLVPHHGNADTAFPFVVAAISPRVAILNNGVMKGGDRRAFEVLRAARLEDVWQLHRSNGAGDANFAGEFVVNQTAEPDPGAWLKLTAERNGGFSVTNGRTQKTKAYARTLR